MQLHSNSLITEIYELHCKLQSTLQSSRNCSAAETASLYFLDVTASAKEQLL
jgi:hypothetical protein